MASGKVLWEPYRWRMLQSHPSTMYHLSPIPPAQILAHGLDRERYYRLRRCDDWYEGYLMEDGSPAPKGNYLWETEAQTRKYAAHSFPGRRCYLYAVDAEALTLIPDPFKCLSERAWCSLMPIVPECVRLVGARRCMPPRPVVQPEMALA